MPASLVAALVLSAGAHGALALLADTRAPVEASTLSSTVVRGDGALRLRIRPAASPRATTSPAVPISASPMPRLDSRTVGTRPMRGAAIAVAAAAPQQAATPDGDGDERVERPVPLTYPIIALPPDDDPHRVGVVRLMLVVSSEGAVVRSFVTASALSQDYVDRIRRSFEDMRFRPAIAHGLPRAGWYEVAVNLEFDPQARSLP